MTKSNLIRLTGTDGFGDAFATNDVSELETVSAGAWSAGEFNALFKLFQKLFSRGTLQSEYVGFERVIPEKGKAKFLAGLSMSTARLLMRPRDENGLPFCNLENFPVWIEPTDATATVPDGMPFNTTTETTIDQETGEETTTVSPVIWQNYDPASRGRKIKTIGEHDILDGSFNRKTLSPSETLWQFLQLEESGHFTLWANADYQSLVAANADPSPE